MVGPVAGGSMGASVGSALGPVGAMLGGAGGAALGYGLSHYGGDVQDTARAYGNDPNNPTASDYERAAAVTAANGLLTRIGLKGGLGTTLTKAGEEAAAPLGSTVGETLLNAPGAIGKAAVVGGGVSALGDVANNAIIQGQLPSPDEVATSAIAGGLPGAALRGLTVPGEVLQARKFSDFGPEFNTLADRFDGKDTSTPKSSFNSMKSVETDLKQKIEST